MTTRTIRNGILVGTVAVLLAANATAWMVSGSGADERGELASAASSATEDAWGTDHEELLREARARLGLGDGPLPPLSSAALNPVAPDGQLGEFRHGTWPSLGVGDGNWTHAGVDLVAPCGSRVLTFADGTVVDRIASRGEPGFDSLGYMVLIEHPASLLGRAFRTLYLHLQEPPRVAVGDPVEGGRTVLGRVGATGAALRCHLHFEARFFDARFHPDWENIYGRGDRRAGEELRRDWLDPLLLFRAFPEGLHGRAATAVASLPVPSATAAREPAERSGSDAGTDTPTADLILALQDLERAINAKIDRDRDAIAFAYWSAFEIHRARRLADWIMAPVHIIKTALDLQLFTEGFSGIQTRIKQARSTLELAALTTGFVQANAAVSRLLLDGPALGNALDAMITSASAHPRDAEAFQAEIRRYLEDGTASPIALLAPDDPGAGEGAETQHPVQGVSEVRRALSAELARLKADLEASPPDAAMAEQAASFVRELTLAVKRSAVALQEVPLPETAGATAPPALSLGAVMELNRTWTEALGNYDRDMKIEQGVSVISITSLGVSYLTINTTPLDATGAAMRFAHTVATALDLGSFAFEYTFTTNAREQVNALPHEMVLTLAPEVANLWRLLRTIETTAHGQPEAARPAEPALVVTTSEASAGASAHAGGGQVEITMGDGSALKGQLEAARVPFVSAYGTIEVETSAITSFADGRLSLEDGSVLKGAFGDGVLILTTSRGVLHIPTREVVAISAGGTPEPVAEKAPPAATQDQAVLVGRVLDLFNQPVPGATVRIAGSNLRTATDASGNYRLPYVPGKFRLTIEKDGYDSERFELELDQSATFPVEDKFLTNVPDRAGLYFWGKLDWLPVSACQIEQVERDTGAFNQGGVNRFVARFNRPPAIVHDGTAYFLDMSGAEQAALLPVAADGTILTIVRQGGWDSYMDMYRRTGPDEIEKAAVSLKRGTIGNNRRIVSADLKPGVYAFVSRSGPPGLGPAQSVPTEICYMFELRTAAQVEVKPGPAGSVIGTWSGTVDQPGFEKYPVTMTIISPEMGTTEYPTLNCGGTLRRYGDADALEYIETITYGADRCINNGKIILRAIGVEELQWEYFYPSGARGSSARLNRVPSGETSSGATARGAAERKYEQLRVETGQTTAWIEVPQGGCANWQSDLWVWVWIVTQEGKVELYTPGTRFTHFAFASSGTRPVDIRYYIDPLGNCADAVP